MENYNLLKNMNSYTKHIPSLTSKSFLKSKRRLNMKQTSGQCESFQAEYSTMRIPLPEIMIVDIKDIPLVTSSVKSDNLKKYNYISMRKETDISNKSKYLLQFRSNIVIVL